MKRSRGAEEDLDSDYLRAGFDYSTEHDTAPRLTSKYTELDCAVEDDEDTIAMRCSLPPHGDALSFKSYDEYETHYNKSHVNRCLECRRNFPTDHLLSVHIEEYHDPLVLVQREKGEHTYTCFVEGCERKCLTWQKRRMHLIDKHMYPKNFFFAVTKEGIDGRRSLLNEHGHHRRRSSTATQTKESRRRSLTRANESQQKGGPGSSDGKTKESTDKSDSKPPTDTDMAELTGAMSALNFVPQSVRFGRGRAGFARK